MHISIPYDNALAYEYRFLSMVVVGQVASSRFCQIIHIRSDLWNSNQAAWAVILAHS